MRAGDDMAGHELADLTGGFGARVHGCLDTGDITFADDRNQSATDGDGF